MKMGNLQIENYPLMIVEDAMKIYLCGRFDGVLGFNLVGKGLSFKLDTKDSLLIVTDRKKFFSEEEKGQPSAKYRTKQAYRPLVIVDTPLGFIETVFDTGALNGWIDLPQDYLDQWFRKSPKKRKVLDDLTIQTDTTVKASADYTVCPQTHLSGKASPLPDNKDWRMPVNDLHATTAYKTMRIGSALLKHASLIIDGTSETVCVPASQQPGNQGWKQRGNGHFIQPSEMAIHRSYQSRRSPCKGFNGPIWKGILVPVRLFLREVNGIFINDLSTYACGVERKEKKSI